MYTFFRYFILIVATNCLVLLSKAQEYRISDIADSLKKNAGAVVRFDSISLNILNINGYTYSETKVISVLDNTQEKLGIVVAAYSDRESIKNIRAWLYDASGDLVKRSDATDMGDLSAAGMNLSGSNRIKVLNMQKMKAPFTVKYIVDKEVSGTAFLPCFMPATDFGQAIEAACMSVTLAPGMELKFDSHFINVPNISKDHYSWQIKNYKSVKNEDYGEALINVLPKLDLMLKDYELYDINGSAATWNDIGKFIKALSGDNEDLKKISDRQLNNIFESQQPDIEKVKALFNYLETNFHYAGIEAGIAGWKPEDPLSTMKKKYGDCKGLVTVLKALLKKAGIAAYYSLINTNGNANTPTDFPSLEFNHVILCVPLQKDTIWLECTSPVAPFNYLYTITANHPALLMYNGGARLISTPDYGQKYNRCTSKVSIELNEENSSVINAVATRWGRLQDTLRMVTDQNNQKFTEAVIYHDMRLKNTTIQSYSVKQIDTDSPKIVLSIQLNNESAIRKTDARIFLKTDIFSPVPPVPAKNENRTQPVNISVGFTQTDTLNYSLPVGYIPENFKPDWTKNVTVKFGTAGCSIKYIPETGKLQLIRSFCIKSDTYNKDNFDAFRDFLLQAIKTTCPDLVLRKKG